MHTQAKEGGGIIKDEDTVDQDSGSNVIHAKKLSFFHKAKKALASVPILYMSKVLVAMGMCVGAVTLWKGVAMWSSVEGLRGECE